MLNKRILLIDDEPDIHAVAKIGLEMAASWELVSALSGEEGFEVAQQVQPDAVLLDVMMPGRDGVETIGLFQAEPKTQQIPVIFLTAKAQASDRRQLYILGAHGVITKPFDPLTLASQISGFLALDC